MPITIAPDADMTPIAMFMSIFELIIYLPVIFNVIIAVALGTALPETVGKIPAKRIIF